MTNYNKVLFRLFLILAILVSLPFGLQFILQGYLTSAVNEIEQEMQRKSHDAWQFKFAKIRINIFKSAVQIEDFIASSNDSATNQPVFRSGMVKIKGIGLVSLIFRKKIAIDQILIDEAEIFIRGSNTEIEKDTSKFVNPYELFKEKLNSVYIKKIQISSAVVRYYLHKGDSLPALVSEKSIVSITHLLIDSVTTYAYKRWFNAEKILVFSEDFKYVTRDSLYTIRFSKLAISYQDSVIEMDSVRIIPNFGELAFAPRFGEQTDRIYAEIPKIRCHGTHVKSLLEKRRIVGAGVTIQGLNLTAFRDKNMKRTERAIPTLQEIIRNIPAYVKIDSIQITDGKITYKEIAPGSKTAGVIFFSNLAGTIYNINNDSLLKKHDLLIHAKTKLMGHGDMDAKITFSYINNGSFTMKGHLGPMAMSKFNQVLENNASVLIDKGTIHEIDFNFEAELGSSKGSMAFKYNDLHIRMLDQTTRQPHAIKERVSSLIANEWIIVNDNPTIGKAVRKAELKYTRDPNRFVFNYTWKTLLSGIKATIGLNPMKIKS